VGITDYSHSDGAADIDRVGSGVVNRIGQRVWVWNGLLRYFVPSFIASGPHVFQSSLGSGGNLIK